MVGLNVDLELILETVLVQESNHRLGIVVVLMRGRLSSLWLDGELCTEADLLLVGHGHLQKGCHVVQLTLHLIIEMISVYFVI